ncbi:SDR family NAD(P)-dependent oxidoreductase [Actinomycetospora sp. TBRC 11914]|uniref:SDR family NAD(P)-dependent oxidoreductase n=1 Tax=Actinomycetospora sp. TBRC 11914 TaxID=2729387 RepID=UPI00145EED35|nr:glucose 1-dehydrogenase [Actinomycetospora sp. TBRC 11914]NMO88265.1 glucose 1-dehydrogenase [Actinomycetospora sp. TBRC 11914]
MRLADRVAVITGAGSGMGRAGAELFAAEGAAVVVVDRDAAGAQATTAAVEAAGGRAVTVVADIAEADGNEAAVAAATAQFGGLDVFWANAGVAAPFRPVSDIEPGEFDRLMAVNARGPWLGARAALPALRRRGGGAVVITASLSGLKGRADASAYQASKGATVMLTRSLAREFGPLGIRVNSVCPVASVTAMWPTLMAGYADPDDAAVDFARAVPLGRLATPEDVARAALFLASDDAAFVTGVNLPVDGGASA